jgi:hypothetical protein
MIGELQRLDVQGPGNFSQDGRAIGGAPTAFSTCSNWCRDGRGGPNNGFFEEPGSDHVGGCHVGLADGAVRFISDNGIFSAIGSMQNGEVVGPF